MYFVQMNVLGQAHEWKSLKAVKWNVNSPIQQQECTTGLFIPLDWYS